MTVIRNAILEKLNETEQSCQVRIPLAIESGSRGWGFASPDSDYDCRFVYVHPKNWYLSVHEKKDQIEYAADAVFDIIGWDLKKFLRHVMKSNAVVFEWLSSNDVYRREESVVCQLCALAEAYFNPLAASYHYLSIAKNALADILPKDKARIKKYFYALRPVANLQYIRQHGKMPYMEYDRTLAEIGLSPDIANAIQALTEAKKQSAEGDQIHQDKLLIDYVQSEIDFFTAFLKEYKVSKTRDQGAAVDEVFINIIESVWQRE